MMTTDASARHPVNIGHLVMGLAFVGLALVWLVVQGDSVTTEEIGWILPLPWLFAGAAGLLVTVLRPRRQRAAYDPGPGGSRDLDPPPYAPVRAEDPWLAGDEVGGLDADDRRAIDELAADRPGPPPPTPTAAPAGTDHAAEEQSDPQSTTTQSTTTQNDTTQSNQEENR